MIVRLAPSVFEDPSLFNSIIYLLELSKIGRLYLAVEDDDAIAYADWLAGQPQDTREQWRVALDWSELDQASFQMQSVLADRREEDETSNPPQLRVDTAARLGAKTFDILVENQRNDRAFLLAFAGENKDTLMRLEAANVIRFAGAGGIGELKAVLRDQTSKQHDRRLKNFALFDSDGEVPGHVSTAAQAVLDEAAMHGVPAHCLERRAIENYLSTPTIFDFAGSRHGRDQRQALHKIAEAFKPLTAEQKAHFPMKVGLPDNPSRQQEALYASVSRQHRATLSSGFTDRLSEMYNSDNEPKVSAQIEADSAKDEVRRAIQAILFYTRAPV